jgi:hypothetical protein
LTRERRAAKKYFDIAVAALAPLPPRATHGRPKTEISIGVGGKPLIEARLLV